MAGSSLIRPGYFRSDGIAPSHARVKPVRSPDTDPIADRQGVQRKLFLSETTGNLVERGKPTQWRSHPRNSGSGNSTVTFLESAASHLTAKAHASHCFIDARVRLPGQDLGA